MPTTLPLVESKADKQSLVCANLKENNWSPRPLVRIIDVYLETFTSAFVTIPQNSLTPMCLNLHSRSCYLSCSHLKKISRKLAFTINPKKKEGVKRQENKPTDNRLQQSTVSSFNPLSSLQEPHAQSRKHSSATNAARAVLARRHVLLCPIPPRILSVRRSKNSCRSIRWHLSKQSMKHTIQCMHFRTCEIRSMSLPSDGIRQCWMQIAHGTRYAGLLPSDHGSVERSSKARYIDNGHCGRHAGACQI